MATVALTVREYNDALVRAALAAHRATAPRNGNPGKGPSREGARRGIAGRENPPSGTRINTGDSIRVSVTPGRAQVGQAAVPGATPPRRKATGPASARFGRAGGPGWRRGQALGRVGAAPTGPRRARSRSGLRDDGRTP